jgi:hypothetical protein
MFCFTGGLATLYDRFQITVNKTQDTFNSSYGELPRGGGPGDASGAMWGGGGTANGFAYLNQDYAHVVLAAISRVRSATTRGEPNRRGAVMCADTLHQLRVVVGGAPTGGLADRCGPTTAAVYRHCGHWCRGKY